MGLPVPQYVTWVTAAEIELLFTRTENWAEPGPVENLGKVKKPGKQDWKKKVF